MAHRQPHAPSFADSFEHDDDDVESMRRVHAPRDHRRRRSSSSSRTSDQDYAFPTEPSEPRISVLGPKLTRVSDAPWERGDPLHEDEEDVDNGLDNISLFGSKSRTSRLDWKRPFAQQPRSSSASRPSRDFGSTAISSKDKGSLSIYGNSYASRSAASLSVYSVSSGKDVFAADDAPPLPIHIAPSTATFKDPRARTLSAGASARSSMFSAASSRSHNSSSGNEVPPMPFPRGFDHVESPHSASHPYANPDLVESKPSLYRSDTTNSTQDDGMSLRAPSLSHTSGTRSPRSPRSPLVANGKPTNLISTPMPAAPGALQGFAMTSAWPNGGTSGQSYSLISLEQAQAIQRAKMASQHSAASSPATTTFPVSTLPYDAAFAERERQRKASTTSAASYLPPEPAAEHNPAGAAQGPPSGKGVKPRRSGFLKLLRGNSKDKDVLSSSPIDANPPALPPLPSGSARPVITHPHAQRPEPRDAVAPGDRRQPASPSGSDSPGAPASTSHSVTASPAVSASHRIPPPSLSLVTPATSPNQTQQRSGVPPRGLTVDVSASSKAGHPETPPRSAPPRAASYDAPLQIRPMSTLFSGLPTDLFNRTEGSPASALASHAEADDDVASPLPQPAALVPAPDEVENWRATIASLEQEVKDLRMQMAAMRSMAGPAICDKCGAHLAQMQSAQSLASMSATDSSLSMGTSSSMSSTGTYSSRDTTQAHHDPDHSHDHDLTPPTEAWRAQGISVVNRPRARTAGASRTTFAGMWREGS